MRWKRRWVEKSKTQLFHPAWKSRQPRGIPTFPPLRRLRLYEQKQKPKTGHFTCYKKRTFSLATNRASSGSSAMQLSLGTCHRYTDCDHALHSALSVERHPRPSSHTLAQRLSALGN